MLPHGSKILISAMRSFLLRIYYSFQLIEKNLIGTISNPSWLITMVGRGKMILLVLLILLELGFLSFTFGVLSILLGSQEILSLILNNDYTFKVIVIIAYFFLPTIYFFKKLRDMSGMVKTTFDVFDSEQISQKRRWIIISIAFFALCICLAFASSLWCYCMLNDQITGLLIILE